MKQCNTHKTQNIIICICGMAGSGKSTVAMKLAEHYSLNYYSGGDALKSVAEGMGWKISGEGWWETEEGQRFLIEREKNTDIDRKVDEALLEKASEGGVIFDSWAIPWLINKGFKIWLEASEEIRAQRIGKRDGIDRETALKLLKIKEEKTEKIYNKLYNFELGKDFSPFDIILNVDKLTKEEIFNTIKIAIDHIVLKYT